MARSEETVIVVGAGVFGTTAALELCRRGYRVTQFDTGPVPRNDASSTDISKAIRMDYGSDAFYCELAEQAIQGWNAWNGAWERPLYHASGFLLLSREPLAPGGFEHDSFALLSRRGHALERLDRETLAWRFPAWNADGYPDGYFNPTAGWAESGAVVARLAAQARRAGVDLREGPGMRELAYRDSRVLGIQTTDGEIHLADRVVLATGAWTPVLLPELREVMWPVAQPVLHFRPDDPYAYQPPHFTTWAADIANTGWYGFPVNAGGLVKVANHGPGRTLEPGEGGRLEREDEERFRAFLAEALPSLARAPLEGGKLCFYCDTWDGDFWIDHHPERPGLFVAAGGSGHGFKFAPVLGEIIADRLEGRPNRWGERFRWRRREGRTTEGARHL